MTYTPFETALLTLLGEIAISLGSIARYTDHLHREITGEREYEIAGYVRGENAGGPLVHLYSSHPGLKRRVGGVYVERFDELPFDPTQGKLWDGEAAPTKEVAQAKGYWNAVPPFRAVFVPTGAKTEAGLAVYRFDRVAGGMPANRPEPAPSASAAPAPTGGPQAGVGTKLVSPITSHAPAMAASAAPAPTGGPQAKLVSPPITSHGAAMAASAVPAPTAGPQAGGTAKLASHQPLHALIERHGPLAPEKLKSWLNLSAAELAAKGRGATASQVAAVHQALEALAGDEEARRRAQEWLTGEVSMSTMAPSVVLALHGWLRPALGNGPTDPWCAEEMALVLDLLRPAEVFHPAWESSADAIAWAHRVGGFALLEDAQTTFQHCWKVWGRPEPGPMFQQWEAHVTELRAAAD